MSERRELPNGWRWVQLRDVCENPTGQRNPALTPEDAFTYVDISSVDNDQKLILAPKTLFGVDAPSRARKIIREGDVIVSTTRPNLNAVALVPAELDNQICSTGFCVLRPVRTLIDPGFLFGLVRTNTFVSNLSDLVKGALYPAVTDGQVLAQLIPLPPLPEQRRIAAVLEEKLAAVEQARQAARAQLDAARALPAAYLRAVFEGEEARGWPVRPLGDVLLQRREVIHPRNNPRGEATFVGLEHVESGTGNRIGSLPVRMEELTGRKPKFYQNDIVYGYLRPYLNKVWVAEFEGLCSVDQYVYSVNNELASVGFVVWFMRSPTFLNRAPIDTTPGQLPRIRIEEVAAVDLNLPPLDVQQQILEKLLRQMETVKQLTDGLESQLTELEAIPAAYLQQAFSGEL